MSEITISGPIAYMSTSGSAVYFSKSSPSAGVFKSDPKGTAAPVKALQNALGLAYWGEDNRFPQNIEQQMAYCGIGKAALNWKAKAYWGSGIIAGKVIDYTDGGKTEVFQPVKPGDNKVVYSLLNDRALFRFFIEYLQDWAWYGNCFPEMVLSYDAKTITGFVHQESCDSRFVCMDENGNIPTVYLSKLWGAARDQYAKFDPDKALKGLINNPTTLPDVDGKFVKKLDCIDMYNSVDSLADIAQKQLDQRGIAGFKSAILPVNYPSPNKTYYQVSAWDGARMGGWVEIACKNPAVLKTMYNKAYRIQYHIEVPESYFEVKFGLEEWRGMSESKQLEEKKKLLKEMDDFLAGDENAYKQLVSFFQIDAREKTEYGRIKITKIDNSNNIDKDILTQSAADLEILIAMEVHPSLFSAGMTGNIMRSGGGSGSDIREAFLVYNALLNLERNVLLEPLYLMRDYNRIVGGMDEWEEDLVFRVRDTVLTTLDQNKGTTKVVS